MNAQLYYENDQCFISGNVDFSTVEKLWRDSLTLLKNRHDYTFNFSKVTFANSASIALLIEWVKYANSHNKICVFKEVPESIVSLAKISGVDGLLKLV